MASTDLRMRRTTFEVFVPKDDNNKLSDLCGWLLGFEFESVVQDTGSTQTVKSEGRLDGFDAAPMAVEQLLSGTGSKAVVERFD